MRKVVLASFVAAFLFLGCHNTARAQVPEIPRQGLGDIARAVMTPGGPVIFYDPMICAQMGALACRFFRAHEYGHIVLGHLGGVFPPMAEMQADCFAATNAAPAEVQAGVQTFMAQGNGGDAAGHGTGFQRARRVVDMATSGNCHW